MRAVGQTLAHRAHAQLLLDRPEEALAEVRLLHDLRRLVGAAPAGRPVTLVEAMIHASIAGLHTGAVAVGLRTRAWREPDLAALERQLSETGLILTVFDGLRSEQEVLSHLVETLSRRELGDLFGPGPKSSLRERWLSPKWLLVRFAPRGWLHRNLVWHARAFQEYRDTLDPVNQVVRPRESDQQLRRLATAFDKLSPSTFLASMVTPNFSRGLETAAHQQTRVNQARIVCALDRYHGAHDQYPETLAALVPRFLESVPHDLIGGQPLRYRRTAEGGFRLYSIGWNERDDGGTALDEPGQRHPLDWVWE